MSHFKSGITHGGRPLIMGILNVTPDSFSDGGDFYDPNSAICRAGTMVLEGADIIDVGGESTRPGSDPVSAELQLARVLPVIMGIRQQFPSTLLISVDTTRAIVAKASLEAGANIVNDVSAGRDDPDMFDVVAERGAYLILVHMKGSPKSMQDAPSYGDVVAEVYSFLESRSAAAVSFGISPDRIILDPGIGFGKRRQDNLRLMAELKRFTQLGYPLLLGTSRKRFMGAICGGAAPSELLGATVATTAYGLLNGVKIFRVHDVRANRQAADVIAAITSEKEVAV